MTAEVVGGPDRAAVIDRRCRLPVKYAGKPRRFACYFAGCFGTARPSFANTVFMSSHTSRLAGGLRNK